MTADPSLRQLVDTLRGALSEEASAIVGRDGRTQYDIACDAMSELARTPAFNDVPGFILEIGQHSSNEPVEWWLRFLGLVEEIRPTQLRGQQELLTLYVNYPPVSGEARAYLLRYLAYVGCNIQWDGLPSGCSTDDLAKEYPLIVADALVWAKKLAAARKIIEAARENGQIDVLELTEMCERWSDMLGEPFLLSQPRKASTGGWFTSFRDRVKMNPPYWMRTNQARSNHEASQTI